MAVKKRNIAVLVLQVVLLVLAFVPGYEAASQVRWNSGHGSTMSSSLKSLWVRRPDTLLALTTYAAVLIMVIAAVLFAVQFLSKGEKRNWKAAAYFPIAEIITFAAVSFVKFRTRTLGDIQSYFDPSYIFFVMALMLIVLTFISVFTYRKAGRCGIIEETPKVYKTQIVNPVVQSEADEVLKFKKLLDDGVITQKEFEDKKQQLLDRH